MRTSTPPAIDGRLDDAVWSQATIVEDFHQVTPREFSSPTERTIVYLLYDDDNLYVAARMFDKEPDKIVARIQRQNQAIGGDDRFFVHLDPFGNRRSGYLFGVNPNGVRFDGVDLATCGPEALRRLRREMQIVLGKEKKKNIESAKKKKSAGNQQKILVINQAIGIIANLSNTKNKKRF